MIRLTFLGGGADGSSNPNAASAAVADAIVRIFPIFEAEHGKYEEENAAFDIHRMQMIVHENNRGARRQGPRNGGSSSLSSSDGG